MVATPLIISVFKQNVLEYVHCSGVFSIKASKTLDTIEESVIIILSIT